MKFDRKTVLALVIALAAGYWLASPSEADKPRDRPVLRWIAAAAKSLLWIAVVADPPPEECTVQARHEVGDDGYVRVQHGEGW